VNYSTLDDETLMRLIVHDRAEALGELYDRYGRLVFSVALNSVGDYATAEEITQDVFLRVWQRAGQYRADQGQVSAWLASIARYRAIDVWRRQSSRPEQHSTTWAEVALSAVPTVGSPAQVTELAMERERVREAVAQLPAEQKEALALAYFKGYTHNRIAQELDLPLGTVKTRIRLAMQKLRQMLQSEDNA
jgi:RNA polymerase sigma-70 factor (ECF subfamily)